MFRHDSDWVDDIKEILDPFYYIHNIKYEFWYKISMLHVFSPDKIQFSKMSKNRKCTPCANGCHSATDAHVFMNITGAKSSDSDYDLPAMVNFWKFFASIVSQNQSFLIRQILPLWDYYLFLAQFRNSKHIQ